MTTSGTKRPILVTGSHRSGSTWVGKMLGGAPGVGYIQEPFSPGHRPGICSTSFPIWFQHVSAANEHEYIQAIRQTLAFKYGTRGEIGSVRSLKDVGRLMRDLALFTYYRRSGGRPLVKDPIAFFSAEWLAARFDMEVVILVRHPAAFVSSLKRLNWTHDFRSFTSQPLLMRNLLESYDAEIRQAAHHPGDIIEQGALLWKIFAGVTTYYRRKNPSWIIRRHEDLSADPIFEFSTLFEELDLEFTERARKRLRVYSGRSNQAEVGSQVIHELRRDSRNTVWTWTDRLSSDEILRIEEATYPEWTDLYSPEEWGEFSDSIAGR